MSKLLTIPPGPDSQEKSIGETLDWLVSGVLAEFATRLETARAMYRRFPDLVTAPDFPDPIRTAFVASQDREPEDTDWGALRGSKMEQAHVLATEYMRLTRRV
jgi:hypothetical protein